MYFVREYKGGGADYDPRQKHYAEFNCLVCNKLSDIDITGRADTFDFQRERICLHCGQKSPQDSLLNLKAQIEQLTQQKNNLAIKIDQLIREAEQLTLKNV